MKITSFACLFALIVSSVAHAHLSERHHKLCESEEAVAMMGDEGACRILIVPQEVTVRGGVCVGKFKGKDCSVRYEVMFTLGELTVKCGEEEEQKIGAEPTAYKVAALIKSREGKQSFLTDNYDHLSLTSLDLNMNLSEENGIMREQTIEFNSGLDDMQMTDVVCTY